MSSHPSAGEFESFLRGTASQDVARLVVRHLLAACRSCRGLLDALGWSANRLEQLIFTTTNDPAEFVAAEPAESYDYGASFENAWRACLEELERPARDRFDNSQFDGDEAALELDDVAAGAEDLVPDPRLINQLLDRGYAARYQDPRQMLRTARLARALAERCDAAAAGSERVLADLRARAWGHLGNALRVTGRLREAERALSTAERLAEAGSGEPNLQVDLLGWRASLHIFERRFSAAIELLEAAERACSVTANHALLAECLVCKAIAWVYSGEPEKALRILDKAILLIDPADRRLLFTAHHNLVTCYLEAGRLQEALALVAQARRLGEDIQEELPLLRVLWQEAKIFCELGMLEEAEAQFCRARSGFLDQDLAYEAALVSLDLTAVYVKLGLVAELRRTIADILPIFSSLRIGRELLASLIQLQQAEDKAQALQLIRALSRELVVSPKLPPSV